MSFFGLLASDSERYLKGKKSLGRTVLFLEDSYKKTQDLSVSAAALRTRHTKGESLSTLLPEVFAVVREAAFRTLQIKHFEVQVLGGIVLHEGNVAEMRTGEGKTLAATLPAALRALSGKGVHIVTVNDYLARRDAVWMGQVYTCLGLTVGVINGQEQSYQYDPGHKDKDAERDEKGSFKIVYDFLRPCTRQEAYAADITYGTNNEFVFDFLRDNTVYRKEDMRQRGFNYAIVDEVDSILIDEARSPLIISASVDAPPEGYGAFSTFVRDLNTERDYTVEEKHRSVVLTAEGIKKAERVFSIDNLYNEGRESLVHGILNALRAKEMYKKDKEYVVQNDEAVIVDEFTGRLQPGRRWKDGLHQAIEAKEGLPIQMESQTVASITFQNYFRMYDTLSGMTGTASTSTEEFYKVYGLRVIEVPTHMPSRRKDNNDRIYQAKEAKLEALLNKVKEVHETGQPILLGTSSIDENEEISRLFDGAKIPHRALNAKNHEQEGEIIAQAGVKGSITLATNLAGRGVDIKLGGTPGSPEAYEEVKRLGGLFIIGSTRNEARRIDDQFRGRSGRQGDVGETQFFVSLDDYVLRVFGGEWIKNIVSRLNMPKDMPIEHKSVTKSIEKAQRRIEGFNFDARRWNLEFDSVINTQRDTVYQKRREILNGTASKQVLEEHLSDEKHMEQKVFIDEFGAELYQSAFQVLVLRAMDLVWIGHLKNLERAKESASLRSYGQREPLSEYKHESVKLFSNFAERVTDIVTQRHSAIRDFLTHSTS